MKSVNKDGIIVQIKSIWQIVSTSDLVAGDCRNSFPQFATVIFIDYQLGSKSLVAISICNADFDWLPVGLQMLLLSFPHTTPIFMVCQLGSKCSCRHFHIQRRISLAANRTVNVFVAFSTYNANFHRLPVGLQISCCNFHMQSRFSLAVQ